MVRGINVKRGDAFGIDINFQIQSLQMLILLFFFCTFLLPFGHGFYLWLLLFFASFHVFVFVMHITP